MGNFSRWIYYRLKESRCSVGKLKKKPNNITELRSLLGLVGYFRRAIPNFSQTSKPLCDINTEKLRFDQQIQTIHQLDRGTPIQLK